MYLPVPGIEARVFCNSRRVCYPYVDFNKSRSKQWLTSYILLENKNTLSRERIGESPSDYTRHMLKLIRFQSVLWGPRWQSGNTLASHLCSRGSIPVMAVSGKAGSCLPLVGSLQYRTLANYMYWFPLPFQLPVVIWPVQCWKRRKTPNKQTKVYSEIDSGVHSESSWV